MSKYLWIQFSIVSAGVFFSVVAGEVSGIAWALCAGYWIWKEKRERARADKAEELMVVTKIWLAQHGIYVEKE